MSGDVYERLKAMAVGYRWRPGDRLNEGALARDLGVSRTPLREALNRLVAERLCEFRPGTGFFCRELRPQEVFDLYELRSVIELAALRLAMLRAPQTDRAALRQELLATGMDATGLTVAEACAADEAFHLGIARLSGNAELVAQLTRINERIRYVRWMQMTADRLPASKAEHLAVATAMARGQGDAAAEALAGHITRRMDQITAAVRRGISEIYMDEGRPVEARLVEETAE